ncbi:hypothetical protein JOJ88_000769 [Pantoea cypripedii]|nr:hypothetical protein [Pantoea cypripedii]
MAANKTFESELRADRYMLSNHLMGAAADNHRHLTPGLPVKPGFLLHGTVLKHELAVRNS